MNVSLKRVTTEDEFDIWYELYKSIFTKDEDDYPKELMKSWWPHCILYIIYSKETPAGMIFEGAEKEAAAAMMYYTGLLPEFRGQSIYTSAAEINARELKKQGLSLLIFESENPAKMKDQQERTAAIKRLNSFINKTQLTYINPSPVPYLRSATLASGEDPHTGIQDEYMLGFKIIDNEVEKELNDRVAKGFITKEDYKRLYTLEMLLEKGMESLDQAIKEYRASEEFIRQLEDCAAETFSLISSENWTKYVSSLEEDSK